jgi:prephenate dehydrogenase
MTEFAPTKRRPRGAAAEAVTSANKEQENPYRKTRFVVIGGAGQVGTQVINVIGGLKPEIQPEICEKENSFTKFLKIKGERAFIFTTNGKTAATMIEENETDFKEGDILMDFSSIKDELIAPYERLDAKGISIVGVHIGRAPNQPLGGTSVWINPVGRNSEKAAELARKMFSLTHSFIIVDDIKEHHKLEENQTETMFDALLHAVAMQEGGIVMSEGVRYATLNTQLRLESTARTLGQRPSLLEEIIGNPRLVDRMIEQYQRALDRIKAAASGDEGSIAHLSEDVYGYHNHDGTVDKLYEAAGRLGTIDANLRLPRVSVRITDNHPGYYERLLDAFQGVKILGSTTVSDALTPLEQDRHVSPDKVAIVHVQIDPSTVTPEKQEHIIRRIRGRGHKIVEAQWT